MLGVAGKVWGGGSYTLLSLILEYNPRAQWSSKRRLA